MAGAEAPTNAIAAGVSGPVSGDLQEALDPVPSHPKMVNHVGQTRCSADHGRDQEVTGDASPAGLVAHGVNGPKCRDLQAEPGPVSIPPEGSEPIAAIMK